MMLWPFRVTSFTSACKSSLPVLVISTLAISRAFTASPPRRTNTTADTFQGQAALSGSSKGGCSSAPPRSRERLAMGSTAKGTEAICFSPSGENTRSLPDRRRSKPSSATASSDSAGNRTVWVTVSPGRAQGWPRPRKGWPEPPCWVTAGLGISRSFTRMPPRLYACSVPDTFWRDKTSRAAPSSGDKTRDAEAAGRAPPRRRPPAA